MFSRKAANAIQDGHESIAVHERHRKFKFGNGTEQRAASFVEPPQFLAGNEAISSSSGIMPVSGPCIDS